MKARMKKTIAISTIFELAVVISLAVVTYYQEYGALETVSGISYNEALAK